MSATGLSAQRGAMNDMTKLSAASDAAAANTLAMLAGEKRPDLIRDEVLAERDIESAEAVFKDS